MLVERKQSFEISFTQPLRIGLKSMRSLLKISTYIY